MKYTAINAFPNAEILIIIKFKNQINTSAV